MRGPGARDGARDGAPRWAGADAAALPAAEAAELRERLRGVKHIVVVLSGKGGVGKSTFSALLARGLAADEGKQVGRHRLIWLRCAVRGFASRALLCRRVSTGLRCFVFQVALLDVDICGPSIPKMMGLEGEQVRSDRSYSERPNVSDKSIPNVQ